MGAEKQLGRVAVRGAMEESGGPFGPIPPDDDDFVGNQGAKAPRPLPSLKFVLVVLGVIALLIVAILVTNEVNARQTATKLRKEKMVAAQNSLNERAQQLNLDGTFVRVFYVGNELRTEWRSSDKFTLCIMHVNPPNPKKGINHYSTDDVEVNTSAIERLERPNDIVGVKAVPCGGVG